MTLDGRGPGRYNQRMKTALLLAVLALPASAADKAVPEGARLAVVTGDVTVQSKSGGRLGKQGEVLAAGDAVATADGATAVIALPDRSRLKLREASRAAVTLPTKTSPVTEVLLSIGSVFAKVSKQANGREFRVRTNSAVAAVRGTEFFTAFGRARGKSRDLWICVNEGAVDVETDSSKKPLRVPAGKGILIKSGLDLTKPQAYDWTKTLNWNMDSDKGGVEDKTALDGAYTDLLDQDYR